MLIEKRYIKCYNISNTPVSPCRRPVAANHAQKRRSQRRNPQAENPRFPHHHPLPNLLFRPARHRRPALRRADPNAARTAPVRRRLPPHRHRREPPRAERPAAIALIIKK